MPTAAEDRDAIRALLSRYCFAIDTGAAEDFADLYTVDGRFEGPGEPIVGRQALRALAETAEPGSMHRMVTNEVIDVDGDQASCRSSILLISGGAIVMTGRVHDELRRVDGRWRIAHRRFSADAR
jgi:uncharacterized protein (TIGR02246 family)